MGKKMTKKLTDWFPPGVKPVHPGIYETYHFINNQKYEGYSKWTGQYWTLRDPEINQVKYFIGKGHQMKYWRGLAEKPE